MFVGVVYALCRSEGVCRCNLCTVKVSECSLVYCMYWVGVGVFVGVLYILCSSVSVFRCSVCTVYTV